MKPEHLPIVLCLVLIAVLGIGFIRAMLGWSRALSHLERLATRYQALARRVQELEDRLQPALCLDANGKGYSPGETQ